MEENTSAAPGVSIQESLISAVAHDEPERVAEWLAAGARVGEKDEHGRSALAEATMRFYQRPGEPEKNVAIMRLILESKADPNERWGRNEEPALHLAMAGGSVEAARELVAAGARVSAQNAKGDTALHIAARQAGAKPHAAAYLLSLGIDPKIKNHKGRSALQEALSKNPDVAAVIKAFGEASARMRTQREQKSAPKKTAPGQIDLFEPAAVSAEAHRQEAKASAREAARSAEAATAKPKKRHALTEQTPRAKPEPKGAAKKAP